MPTTFVTAYFDIGNDGQTVEWRCMQFRQLLLTGVRIYLFTNNTEMIKMQIEYPQLVVLVFQTLPVIPWLKEEYKLPQHGNPTKDTLQYIVMQHMKTFFVTEAVNHDKKMLGIDQDSYAWIDLQVFHMFKEPDRVTEWIRWLSSACTTNRETVVIPGFQKKRDYTEEDGNVNWRFCGGFFWGHRDAIIAFHEVSKVWLPHYVEQVCSGTLYWELNFWAWLEGHQQQVRFLWYMSGHNDSKLCNFPLRPVAKRLMDVATTVYDLSRVLPNRDGFKPSSMSHCYDPDKGQHMWVVRYINYTLEKKRGYFLIQDGGPIRSKNLFIQGSTVRIDAESSMQWLTHYPVEDTRKILSYGLEDVRIFMYKGRPWLIGCNVDLTPEQKHPQIVVKSVDQDKLQVMSSPFCQKNWIPFLQNTVTDSSHADEVEFIYGWGKKDIEWGYMNMVTGGWSKNVPFDTSINIETSPKNGLTNDESLIKHPLLQYAKGSSMFVPFRGNTVVGIVHTTQHEEGHALRHYWHHMVVMDATTKKVIAYDGPFYFDTVGVEYCIGFWYADDTFHFWASRLDTDPVYLCCPSTFFVLNP